MADTQPQPHDTPEKKSTIWSDILTVIGFAIIFIIIIWGIIHLVSLVSSSFSSPSGRQNTATLQVIAPPSAVAGEPITVSWKYSPTTQGGYAFVYQCQQGVGFKIQTGTSTAMQVRCGSALELPNGNNAIVVTPELSATSSVQENISIVFIPRTGGAGIQGTASMTITAAQKTGKPSTGASKPTVQHVRHTNNYSAGPADLAVHIISVSFDQTTGEGVATFDIGNMGGETSHSYYFTANLPTAVPYPYQSPLQAPLAPGDHIVSTLRFTDVMPGGGPFAVSIVNGDTTPGNDSDSSFLAAPYTQPGYNYAPQPYTVYPTYTY